MPPKRCLSREAYFSEAKVVGQPGLESAQTVESTTNYAALASTESPRTHVSPRHEVGTGPSAECTDLARLAAKARIVEALSSGDVRLLAGELRAELEALAGPGADVVPIGRKR